MTLLSHFVCFVLQVFCNYYSRNYTEFLTLNNFWKLANKTLALKIYSNSIPDTQIYKNKTLEKKWKKKYTTLVNNIFQWIFLLTSSGKLQKSDKQESYWHVWFKWNVINWIFKLKQKVLAQSHVKNKGKPFKSILGDLHSYRKTFLRNATYSCREQGHGVNWTFIMFIA